MSKAGKNNFQGINTQVKAGLLLFLINLSNSDFDSVTLEDGEWEDFTLNFKSGKKIICETKSWGRPLGWADVLNILDIISKRTGKVNRADEILIVCKEVIEEVENAIRYFRYDLPILEAPTERLADKDRLDEATIKLLKKTSFYKIPSNASGEDYLYDEVLTYFYNRIFYYIPTSELDLFMKKVLVEEIYNKSAEGAQFAREDLASQIELYRSEKIKNIGTYKLNRSITAQMNDILKAIHDKDYKYLLEDLHLTALSAQPQKLFVALEKIEKLPNLELSKWDSLWVSIIDRQYAFRVIHIFADSLNNRQNAQYVLRFLNENLNILTKVTIDPHTREMAFGLIVKALDHFPELAGAGLEAISGLIKDRATLYRDLETRRDYTYEKETVAGTLERLFEIYSKKQDNKAAENLVGLINETFDLVSNDGEFFIYTPSAIFPILKSYALLDFPANFKKLVTIAVDQFNNLRWYEKGFSGWELSGGTSSQWGDNYTIRDRHFISMILKPILVEKYREQSEATWKFITKTCIAREVTAVSARKPDFLNRATIDILLVEYQKGNHSDEALAILQDFIKMRRGIPHKDELIFQSVRDNSILSIEKKWALVDYFLKEYEMPGNVFLEQTVSDLAASGHKQAIDQIAEWMKSPDYHNKQQFHSSYAITMLRKLLVSEDRSIYRKGLEILRAYLASPIFKADLSNWDTYDVSKSVLQVLEKEPGIGIQILQDIYDSDKKLTDNQQILITSVLEKINEDQKALLRKTYEEFVAPTLFDKLKGDIKLVESKFSHKHTREYFVQYADRLAKAELFQEALSLVALFINDEDPMIENSPDDPDGTFNYHEKVKRGDDDLTITTVRGWSAWVLQKFCNLKGRDYLNGKKADILPLVKQLTFDPNYYVRTQAMIPLLELVKNRHAVMPKSKERFLRIGKAQAIENLTFQILEDKDNQRYPVIMKHLAYPLTYMRSMTEKEAMRVLTLYKGLDWDESIVDITSLYVFFAEFRKDAFKGDIFKTIYGNDKYNALNKFDDKAFKELLEEILRNGKKDIRCRLAWQFWRMPEEEGVDVEEVFPIALKYLTIQTENYIHHVFEQIYHFIHDWLETRPEECIALWQKSIKAEKQFLKNNPSMKTGHGDWWPNHYNGEVLVKIKELQGDEEFLKWFDELVSYSGDHDGASSVDEPFDLLKTLIGQGSEEAKSVYKKLIKKQPHRYDKNIEAS